MGGLAARPRLEGGCKGGQPAAPSRYGRGIRGPRARYKRGGGRKQPTRTVSCKGIAEATWTLPGCLSPGDLDAARHGRCPAGHRKVPPLFRRNDSDAARLPGRTLDAARQDKEKFRRNCVRTQEAIEVFSRLEKTHPAARLPGCPAGQLKVPPQLALDWEHGAVDAPLAGAAWPMPGTRGAESAGPAAESRPSSASKKRHRQRVARSRRGPVA